jgi:dephospho-CoA kinase
MIIGVTGTLAAGKDSVSDYLKQKGFFHFSLSDAVRAECEKRGLPKDRDTLVKIANEMRAERGYDILARLAIEAAGASGAANSAITSIRNPKEVEYLKTQPDFILLAIDAPIEMRYERIKKRSRESDFVDFETFKKQEETEMAGGAGKQNLAEVMAMADYKIINGGAPENLREKIENFILQNSLKIDN